MDATNKWPGETDCEWGRVIKKDPTVTAKIDEIWGGIGVVNQSAGCFLHLPNTGKQPALCRGRLKAAF
ncbi:hypothetical protein [Eikenella sp. NML120348]|uniref:hypothetical protein n=1 Tax=Eikenella sp. NML120348 TaxID=1795831 RepID=UPI0018D368EC|nr:hypothetical protein [Eikenella sp. NML120348]